MRAHHSLLDHPHGYSRSFIARNYIFMIFSFSARVKRGKNIFLGKNIIKTMMNCKQSPLEMFFEIGISSFMLKLAQTTNLQDQVIYGAT